MKKRLDSSICKGGILSYRPTSQDIWYLNSKHRVSTLSLSHLADYVKKIGADFVPIWIDSENNDIRISDKFVTLLRLVS